MFKLVGSIRLFVWLVSTLLAVIGFSHALAADAATPTTAPDPTTLVDQASPINVAGFRSAVFDMDETQLRAAVAKDFGKTVEIKSSVNPAERTHSLTVRVPNVLPEGGTADIAYVLGYKTKKLIQVSVVWSKTTDPSITAEKMVADADVLRANFASQGYKADTVLSDVAVRNGILAFRGSDAAGHTTALLLEGRTVADKDRKVFTPISLVLLYIADPKHPDVFRLAPGQF